jgi:hypothetical protein
MPKPRKPRLTKKLVPKKLTTPILAWHEADVEAAFNEKLRLVFEYYEIPLDSPDRQEQLLRRLLPEVFSGLEIKRQRAPGGRRPDVEWHDALLRDFEVFQDEHPEEKRPAIVEQYIKERNLGYDPGSLENVLRSARERRNPIEHWHSLIDRQIPASLADLKKYKAKVSPKYEQRVLVYAGDNRIERPHWKEIGIPEDVVIAMIKGRLIKRGGADRLTLTRVGLARLITLLFGTGPSKR